MQLTGLTEQQVDEIVAGFTKLMDAEAQHACNAAAAQMVSSHQNVIVASPIDALAAIVSTWNTSVQTKLVPYLKNVYAKASAAVTAPLGNGAPKPTATILDDVKHNLVTYANDLWDAGQGAIMIGWQDGETVLAMSDRVKGVAAAKAAKTHSVAQTAVTTVVNGGEWTTMLAVAAKYNAVTMKEWVATHDSHTRPTHWAADGQTVALNEKFSVGDALLDFPGDPFGDLEEIINCRCTTRYDSDIQVQNSSPQTSPDALSADSAVDTTEQISASAATNPNWKAADHPRGKDGKFIKSGVHLPHGVFNGLVRLNNGKSFHKWTQDEQNDFLDDVGYITSEDWDNLTEDQKSRIEQAVGDALDDGMFGAAGAQQFLDNLSAGDVFNDNDEVDLFDPSTPLPGGAAPSGVSKHIQEAASAGFITHDEESKLLDQLALGEISDEEVQQKLMKAMSPSPAHPSMSGMTAKQAEQAIYDAHDAGDITENQQDLLLDALDNNSAPHAIKLLKKMIEVNSASSSSSSSSTPVAPVTPTAPITTGTPKPVKITHGLIHAKHAPGATIAVDTKGNKIVWSGSSYDIIDKDGDTIATNVKKSKLYALLNDFYGDSQWHEPGNEAVNVTHVTPLDAAPAPNPIPHPMGFPAPSAVDTALDDAFGSTNSGVAPDPIQAIIDAHDAGDISITSMTTPDAVSPPPSYSSVLHDLNNASMQHEIAGLDYTDLLSELDDAYDNGSGPEAYVAIVHALAKAKKKKADSLAPTVPSSAPVTTSAPSAPPVAHTIDMTGWVQVGGQGGHNQGGVFQAPDGTQYYVKSLKSKGAAQSEVLAIALYAAAGVNVPQVSHVAVGMPPGWNNVVASRIIPNSKMDPVSLKKPGAFQNAVQKDFAVHAWLANWDAVGSGDVKYSNIVNADGTPWLIDAGGALQYGGAGQINNSKFGDTPIELQTMLNPSVNAETAKVFGGMTFEQQRESAKALLGITDAQIDQLVKDAGQPPSVAKTLKARRNAILKHYGLNGNNASTSNAPVATMAPTNASTPTAPTGSSTPNAVSVDDISGSKKYDFYKHFKNENVSPAWSGAKIYKSMHAAKLKMAGDPKFANLTDAQMLQILDEQHANLVGTGGSNAYSTKVKEWLKTPNGIKAFKDLNPNVASSSPTNFAPTKVTPTKVTAKKTFGKKASVAKTAPAKTTTSSPAKKASSFTGAPVKNTGSWVIAPKKTAAKKTAVKKAAPVAGISTTEALGDTGPVPAGTSVAAVYGGFKAAGYGTYLNSSTPAEIYWNAVQHANVTGLSPGQVLAVVDEEGAKKFGVPNAKSFEAKVKTWLATNEGQVTAARIKSGDWKPNLAAVKKTTGTQAHAANTPLNEKVDDVSGHVPPFDPALGTNDFPVIDTAGAAALWEEMQQTHGDMTPKQKASLHHYTTNTGFSNMNTYLRGKNGASAATQTHIDNAQAGMRPSTRDITVHRGNGPFTDGAGRPWTSFATISQYVGTDLHQEAFFSASVGGKEAFAHMEISMQIEVPAGTPMAYVNAFSQYGDKTGGGGGKKGEREMLLAANLTYRILEVKQSGYQTIVHMRVVPNTEAA